VFSFFKVGQGKELAYIRPDDRVLIQRLERDGPERTEILCDGFESHVTPFGLDEVYDGHRAYRVADEQPGFPGDETRDQVVVVPVCDLSETRAVDFVDGNLSAVLDSAEHREW